MFRLALALAVAGILGAQTPIRVAYECTAAETQAAGLACSEQDPCPVYLELSNVDSAGPRVFIVGNIHTPMATLDSILLGSEDGGKTWAEPHPRIRQSGLDQIQFVDSEHGWISGANLQGAPRDPFFLITNDGGKTWSARRIFEEDRVAAIEGFHFDSPQNGAAFVDATLDNGKREEYRTENGGESWQAVASPERAVKPKPSAPWRLRTDSASHSYVVEQSEAGHWRRLASFLVNLASCKE
jgi:photosystem II stability/assembly factor-like uncharacterized protein